MENSRMVAEMQQLEKKVSDLETENQKLREENKGMEETLGELFEEELAEKLLGEDNELDFSSPLNFAKSLVEHTTHVEAFMFVPEHDRVTFDFGELEEIAEYLLTYCKHNKEFL